MAATTAVLLLIPGLGYGWTWLGHGERVETVQLDHPVGAVRLDVPAGSVVVRPGAEGSVRLRAHLAWSLSEPKLKRSWAGDTLVVSVAESFTGLEDLSPSVWLELDIPPGTAVSAELGSATIDVGHVRGALHLDSDSGAMTIADTQGDLWLHSASGSISGSGLASQDVDARTVAGPVRLTFTAAPQRVTAQVGDAQVAIVVPPATRYGVTTDPAGAVGVPAALRDPDPHASRTIAVKVGSRGSGSIDY